MNGVDTPPSFGYYTHTHAHPRTSHPDPTYSLASSSTSYLDSNGGTYSNSTANSNGNLNASTNNIDTSAEHLAHSGYIVGPSDGTFNGSFVPESNGLAGTSASGLAGTSTTGAITSSTYGPLGSSGNTAQAPNDSLPGPSKRPFPFPLSGPGAQERDKRARSSDGSGHASRTSSYASNAGGSGSTSGGLWNDGGGWQQEPLVQEEHASDRVVFGGQQEEDGNESDATPYGGSDGDAERSRTEEADVDSSIGDATLDDGEREGSMSTDESVYASAAESPESARVDARSPTVAGTPRVLPDAGAFSPIQTDTTNPDTNTYAPDSTNTYPTDPRNTYSTHAYSISSGRRPSPAPRIPTPAALRSSSPLGVSVLSSGDTGSTSTFTPGHRNSTFPNLGASQRPSSSADAHASGSPSRLALLRSPSSSGLPRLPSLSMHILAESEGGYDSIQESTESALHRSVAEPDLVGRMRHGSQSGPLDLGWLTQQLDQALPPPRSLELHPPNASRAYNDHTTVPQSSRPPIPRPSSDSGADIDRPGTGSVRRPFRALPLMRRLRSPEPSLGSTREFMSSAGASFGSSSVDSAFPASALGQRRVPLPWVDLEHEGMSGMSRSTSSGVGESAPGIVDSTSSVMGSERPGPALYGSMGSAMDGSGLPTVAGPVSPEFEGMPSPVGMGSVASTVQSDDTSNTPSTGELDATAHVIEGTNTHTEVDTAGGHSAVATFGSPSTSGSSASARTTPSGFTRQPPPLSLRGFPTSPTFSASSFGMSGPVSASPSSFIVAESPMFPASASPRTSTFDLGVTPPGSALPSFVARMMEVDSPVREGAGGDAIGHAYTIPELVLEPRGEDGVASMDALRRFAQTNGEDSLGRSPDHTLGDEAVGSYFAGQPAPHIRREPIRFSLGALGTMEASSPTEELSAQSLRRFDAANGHSGVAASSNVLATEPVPPFPPPREDSEIAQQGSSAFSAHTNSTAHRLEDSDPVWSPRLSDLGSAYSQRLTESGVTYPSRPSESGASLPSFRANVSPGPELNMGSRPGRLVRDVSWSFSDFFGPGREDAGEALSASGSETSLRPRVSRAASGEQVEGTGRSSRAGVRSALSRAVGLAGSARGSESLPRLHLNALPRVSGAEPSRGQAGQDERPQAWGSTTTSTNLSRTPPGAGAAEHNAPSFAEAWLEEGSGTGPRGRPLSSRRMSAPRWMDLFAESSSQPVAVPTELRSSNRPRMPPAVSISSTDSSTLFDPLSGMSWNRGSHTPPVPFIDSQPMGSETRQEPVQDTAASLARYQTFAQSIDELRRSPPLQQPPAMSSTPRNLTNGGTGLRLPPVIAPSTNAGPSTGLGTAHTESNGQNEISTWYSQASEAATGAPWGTPRHESLARLNVNEPQHVRNPYSLSSDNRQSWAPPAQEPSREPSSQASQPGGNWLREWERERDRLSRAAREDYMRRRETGVSNNTPTSAAPNVPEPRRRPTPSLQSMTQLSDTQAQGRMWDEYNARHEPRPWPMMTRATLEATGFADDDLSNDNGNSAQLWGSMPRHPSRRPETLPPRTNDVDAPMQFPPETTSLPAPEIPFTESPPSLFQELIDLTRQNQYDSFSSDVFQSFQRANSQRQQPEHNPADFRHASQALRRSLDTTRRNSRERDSSSRAGSSHSPLTRRWLGLGDSPTLPSQGNSGGQPERSRMPGSRDRWETQYRSQSQFDRVRQLLHPRDFRERDTSRRHLTDLGQPSPNQQRRRSYMSVFDAEPSSPAVPLDQTSSTHRPSVPQWPRESPVNHSGSQLGRPPSLRHDSSWSSAEGAPRNNFTHELLRAASRVRRRRTLLPESSSRRSSPGFLNSMHHAFNQVESGLHHINRELSALADESGGYAHRLSLQAEPAAPQANRSTHNLDHENAPSPSHMDWTFERNLDQIERSSPPTLPPFEFAHLQRNSDWPPSRRNYVPGRHDEGEELPRALPAASSSRPMSTRGLSEYLQRQSSRGSLTREIHPSYAYNNWRSDTSNNETWSNEVSPSSTSASQPLRDRLLFRASVPSREPTDTVNRNRPTRHPELPTVRTDSAGSSTHSTQTSALFGRSHRRRLSPPTPSDQPTPSTTLPRPFGQPPTSPSPPRPHASRWSQFIPRRSFGRGSNQSGANSDDNEEWNYPGTSGRMFFLRPRGRVRTTSGGDFLRDEEFDDSYEGLLRLAARIGDVKPRGTPAEVIQAMPSGSYANSPGAKAETRCPICLDDYAQEDVVALIKRCSHWFHKECIQQWLGNSRTCPVCRGQADGEAGSEPEAGPSNSAHNSTHGSIWM